MITTRKPAIDREIYTVAPHLGGWAVEHNGEFTDLSPSKDEARASANRRARAAHEAGRPCQVTIRGESGFFGAGAR